jgi:hypothetical protein
MLDPEFRRYLDELYRTDDRLRAEHRAWQTECQAQAVAQASESEPEAVGYQTVDDNSPAPAPASNAEPFYEEVGTAPNFFDDVERNEEFADTLAYVLAKLQDQWRDEIAEETCKLAYLIERLVVPGERAEREVYELRARMLNLEVKLREVGGDLTETKAMLGDVLRRYAAEPQVIELPGNFVRHTSIDRDGKVTLIRRRRDDAA